MELKILQTDYERFVFRNENLLKAIGLSINDRISSDNKVEKLFYNTFAKTEKNKEFSF